MRLNVYIKGTLPVDRKTELFADRSQNGIYVVRVNVIEMRYQLCLATCFKDPSCGQQPPYLPTSCDDEHSSGDGGGGGHRQLAAAPVATGSDTTFYASVECSGDDDASYKLLATKTQSRLVNEVSMAGGICPGKIVYHHWEHTNVNQTRSVKFHITMHSGDATVLVRKAQSFDEAPMKLAPPFTVLQYADGIADVMYCSVADVQTAQEHVYVMFNGGGHCMSYEIVAVEISDSECLADAQGGDHGAVQTSYEGITNISPHLFIYGSCEGSQWIDYALTLTADDYHYSFLIEVEDLTAGATSPEPTALKLVLFAGHIAPDRFSEQLVDRAIDGIYSLTINRHTFIEGNYYASVHCEEVGSTKHRYRMIVYKTEEFLESDVVYHGEVAPEQWVYHSYTVPPRAPNAVPHNISFQLTKRTGDLDIVVRHDTVPTKRVPPFVHADASDSYTDTQVCCEVGRCAPGSVIYLGMLGGAHAASYEILVTELPYGAPCAEPSHSSTVSTAASGELHKLDERKLKLGSCKQNGWYDAYIDVSVSDLSNNVVFELEDRGASGVLDAVSIYMWATRPMGRIPASRFSEYATHRSYDNVYSLSVSMHELEAFLSELHQSGETTTNVTTSFTSYLCREDCNFSSDGACDDGGPGAEYGNCAIGADCQDCGQRDTSAPAVRLYFGVRCGAKDVTFQMQVSVVHSLLRADHVGHGEVCPREWVYHELPIDAALVLGSSGATQGSGADHRRLAALDAHSQQARSPPHEPLAATAAPTSRHLGWQPQQPPRAGESGRRALAPSSADVPGVHVKLHVIKNVGSMNVMATLNDKPLRLVPDEALFLLDSDDVVDIIICNVERFYNMSQGVMRYFLGINGGTACAQYEIKVSTFTSSCAAATRQMRLQPAFIRTQMDGTIETVGARDCPRGASACPLSPRHHMRGSCRANERAPPIVLAIPYMTNQALDNFVVQVEDLNPTDNPSSLSIVAYPMGERSSLEHEKLLELTPLRTVNFARKRIFSFGISAIEVLELVCKGECTSSGTFYVAVVASCASSAVAFRAIYFEMSLELELNVPVHGEVCPGSWLFHSFDLFLAPSERAQYRGVRFQVHLHSGDVYYMMSRWERTPDFSACNQNELAMSGERDGRVDLCGMQQQLDLCDSCVEGSTSPQCQASNMYGCIEDARYPGRRAPRGYMGLYGGTSCAEYTIQVSFIRNDEACSTATTGTCDN